MFQERLKIKAYLLALKHDDMYIDEESLNVFWSLFCTFFTLKKK